VLTRSNEMSSFFGLKSFFCCLLRSFASQARMADRLRDRASSADEP
jgi:hypothetical protein